MHINNTQYSHQYLTTYFHHNISIPEKWCDANQSINKRNMFIEKSKTLKSEMLLNHACLNYLILTYKLLTHSLGNIITK